MKEFFRSRPSEVPVAVVDFVNDQAGLKDNHVRDHGVVERIGIFGDVEVFLDFTPRVREERPVRADSGTIFVRLRDVIGANRDQSAIANLEFPMELNQPLRLPAVLGSVSPATEDQDHGILSLQFGELPTFRGMVA